MQLKKVYGVDFVSANNLRFNLSEEGELNGIRTRIVAATQKGRSAVAKATPLWNEVQRKVRQKMGESSWHELMQNLGGFLKVTDQLTNQNDRNV